MIDGIYVDSGGNATLGDFFSDTSYSGGPGGDSGIGCVIVMVVVLLIAIWMCV